MKSLFFLIISFTVSLWSCQSEKDPMPVDCSVSELVITASEVTDASTCNSNDGSITVAASGGMSPYNFRLGTGDYHEAATFSGLAPGLYTIHVKDAVGCEKVVEASILPGTSSSLAFINISTTDAGCETADGSITVEATGEGAVQYKINDGVFQQSGIFSGIEAGNHNITIRDESGCESTGGVKVFNGTSFKDEIEPILLNNCAVSGGCHDGANGSTRNWKIFSNVKDKAALIKSKTQSGEMPPGDRSITQEQIDLIACWVDDGALEN